MPRSKPHVAEPDLNARASRIINSSSKSKLPVEGMEVVDDQIDIEPVSQHADLSKLVADESFMNEQVVIEIAESTNENDQPYALVSCNGSNVVIPRGQPATIRRKYLEVLARMKETKYTQRLRDPGQPDSLVTEGRTALAFPFQVLHDTNRRGREWLRNILSEPA